MLFWSAHNYKTLIALCYPDKVNKVSVEKLILSLSLSKMIVPDHFRSKEISMTRNTLVSLDLTRAPEATTCVLLIPPLGNMVPWGWGLDETTGGSSLVSWSLWQMRMCRLSAVNNHYNNTELGDTESAYRANDTLTKLLETGWLSISVNKRLTDWLTGWGDWLTYWQLVAGIPACIVYEVRVSESACELCSLTPSVQDYR